LAVLENAQTATAQTPRKDQGSTSKVKKPVIRSAQMETIDPWNLNLGVSLEFERLEFEP
jgi:hypothetical protein